MKIIVVFALLLSANFSLANEEIDANNKCKDVAKLHAEEIRKKTGKSSEYSQFCDYNTKPLSYWACTESRMQNGQTFLFATSRCEKLSKK